jgi:hypothetical protein
MSDAPQHIVSYLGESGIGKGGAVAICGTQRDNSYPHSRHKVSLYGDPTKDWLSVRFVPESSRKFGRRLALNAKTAGCSVGRMRNKNVLGFTTYYKELMKRSAPTLRSILG